MILSKDPFLYMKRLFILHTTHFFSCIFFSLVLLAQNKPDVGLPKMLEDGYYNEKFVDYSTRIFDENIKTLLLYPAKAELEQPIIQLNRGESLTLRFDDLGENFREMYYRFEHCTYDWKSSELQPMDYQRGFDTDIITNYEYSFNTVQPYTHYRLEFPNNRISLTRSGNYIITVFTDNDEEDVMLTARFQILEPLAQIAAVLRNSSVVSERDYRQEIDIEVNLSGIESRNPYAEIELVVMQNQRVDNEKRNVKPSFVKDKELTYNYQGELTFDGINEFRFVDAKSVKYRSEEVSDVILEDRGYHIYLAPDQPRAYTQYTFENDINGRFLIRNDDMTDPHLESDYVDMTFKMPVLAPLGNGNLYIFGQLSNWQLAPLYKMDYKPDDLLYEKTVRLKQGYYNYLYIWRYKSMEEGSTMLTEGNHAETDNEYTIFVYFKDRSNFSHRLVGYKVFNTLKK